MELSTGVTNEAIGFTKVQAAAGANAGGEGDVAYLDGADGADHFRARDNYATIRGAGFDHQVSGFDRVVAQAMEGRDRAYLHAAAGTDNYDYDHATGTGRMTLAGGVKNEAVGFDTVHAYGTAEDSATLDGSAGSDLLYAAASQSWMRSAQQVNVVTGFGTVQADAAAGGGAGSDRATFIGSTADDTFNAAAATNTASMTFCTTATSTALGFDTVHALAGAGTGDQALLSGSAQSDAFHGWSNNSRLSGLGYSYTAFGFDIVEANAAAVAGGTDTAFLHDSAGADEFFGEASTNTARIEYSGGQMNKAIGFDRVFADAGTGDAIDKAWLYDSASNDTLEGRGLIAELSRAGSYYFNLQGFDEVAAESSQGGSDRKDVALLDYLLTTTGGWL
jgi:hypothetical protein